jgi:hypothetical protein
MGFARYGVSINQNKSIKEKTVKTILNNERLANCPAPVPLTHGQADDLSEDKHCQIR